MVLKSLSPLLFILSIVQSIPIDNGVDGVPEIECGSTVVTVYFNIRKAFKGHVYVKPRFLTKVDRAYRISCFYMESSKEVATQLNVDELTTTSADGIAQMPICRYDILDGGPHGESVRYGKIGQQVYHRWSCTSENANTFCMRVHSCVVDDGKGDRVNILDTNGCAIDRHVLNNIEYPDDLVAGQETHVYKYADRDSLFYQCQISIQMKRNGECQRPTCSDLLSTSSVTESSKVKAEHENATAINTTSTAIPFQQEVAAIDKGPHSPNLDFIGDRLRRDYRPRRGDRPVTVDPRLLRRRRNPHSTADSSMTVDVRAEMNALEIIDTLPRPESNDVCLSRQTLSVTIFLVIIAYLSLVCLTIVLAIRFCLRFPHSQN